MNRRQFLLLMLFAARATFIVAQPFPNSETEPGENVELVGQFEGSYTAVAVRGSYAYLVGPYGFEILNVTDPGNPALIGGFPLQCKFLPGMAVSPPFACVSDGTNRITIIDISDPTLPLIKSEYRTNTINATVAAIHDGVTYVTTRNSLVLIDLEQAGSETPMQSRRLQLYGDAPNAAFRGTLACLPLRDSLHQLMDLTDPASPVQLGSLVPPNRQNAGHSWLSGSFAFIEDVPDSGADYCTALERSYLHAFDISDVRSPKFLWQWGVGMQSSRLADVEVEKVKAFILGGNHKFEILDLTNPTEPRMIAKYSDIRSPYDLESSDGLVFLACHDRGLLILRYTGPNP